jgi:hypothetical protein
MSKTQFLKQGAFMPERRKIYRNYPIFSIPSLPTWFQRPQIIDIVAGAAR